MHAGQDTNVHVLAHAVASMLAKIIRRLRIPRAFMLAKSSYSSTHASRKHDFFLRLDAGPLDSCAKTVYYLVDDLVTVAKGRKPGGCLFGSENLSPTLGVVSRHYLYCSPQRSGI